MQRSSEDLQSSYGERFVDKIKAALAVCGRAQGWDEDISAAFMDDLTHAWDTTHVYDQSLPVEGPHQLAKGILAELDKLKRELDIIHGPEGTETVKKCLEKKLVSLVILCKHFTKCSYYCTSCFLQEASKKDLIWKIERFHAALLAHRRAHLSRTNSLGEVRCLLSLLALCVRLLT